MGIFDDYVAYLKDNPNGYWFKRKLYGWGWTPARWQGWLVTGAFMVIVLGLLIGADTEIIKSFNENELLIIVALITTLFVGVVWKTGEPPKWQWGIKRK